MYSTYHETANAHVVEILEPWYRAYWINYNPIKHLWMIVAKDNFGNVLDYVYV